MNTHRTLIGAAVLAATAVIISLPALMRGGPTEQIGPVQLLQGASAAEPSGEHSSGGTARDRGDEGPSGDGHSGDSGDESHSRSQAAGPEVQRTSAPSAVAQSAVSDDDTSGAETPLPGDDDDGTASSVSNSPSDDDDDDTSGGGGPPASDVDDDDDTGGGSLPPADDDDNSGGGSLSPADDQVEDDDFEAESGDADDDEVGGLEVEE